MLVREVMSDPVATLGVGDTLAQAEETMRRARVRRLPVTDGSERLLGLVTRTTVLTSWVSHGDPAHERHADVARDVPVEMLMQRNVISVGPDAPAAEAARLMESRRIGCLPVVSEGRLVGIVTEADFVRLARVCLERAAH
jgi:CBS domain-containing protein